MLYEAAANPSDHKTIVGIGEGWEEYTVRGRGDLVEWRMDEK